MLDERRMAEGGKIMKGRNMGFITEPNWPFRRIMCTHVIKLQNIDMPDQTFLHAVLGVRVFVRSHLLGVFWGTLLFILL